MMFRRPFRRLLFTIFVVGGAATALGGHVANSTALAPTVTPRPSSWQAPVQLSSAGGGAHFGALAASGRTLYVTYPQGRSIYFRKSIDEGATWTRATVVALADELPLTEPLVAIGSTVHLAYTRANDLYYRRSTDRGATWSNETLIAKGLGGHFYRLSLDATATTVHLAWVQHDNTTFASTALFYRRSLDEGVIWQSTVTLVPPVDQPGRPALSVHGKGVHLAWADERDRNPPCYTYPACPEVYYKHSTNNGATWTRGRRMTFGRGAAIGRPDVLALAHGAVSLVWQNDRGTRGGEEIYSNYSRNGGVTWAGAQRLTFTPHESEHPATAGFKKTELLVWFDRRNARSQEEYARLSRSAGAKWSAEEQVTRNGQVNAAAQAAVTSNYAHIVWPVNDDYMEYSRRPLRAPSRRLQRQRASMPRRTDY
jgi:hypothetical protein